MELDAICPRFLARCSVRRHRRSSHLILSHHDLSLALFPRDTSISLQIPILNLHNFVQLIPLKFILFLYIYFSRRFLCKHFCRVRFLLKYFHLMLFYETSRIFCNTTTCMANRLRSTRHQLLEKAFIILLQLLGKPKGFVSIRRTLSEITRAARACIDFPPLRT